MTLAIEALSLGVSFKNSCFSFSKSSPAKDDPLRRIRGEVLRFPKPSNALHFGFSRDAMAQYLSSFFLRKARLPLSTPATASRVESRLEVGIASDSLAVSPSFAPASSSNPFGIITAGELPTLLIRPLRTFDIVQLILPTNYTRTAAHGAAAGLRCCQKSLEPLPLKLAVRQHWVAGFSLQKA